MSNKQAVQYQKIEILDIDTDIEADIENEEEEKHPLESERFWVKLYHYLFHIWIFKLIRITQKPRLDFMDITQSPKHMTIRYNYEKWIKIYNNKSIINKNVAPSSLWMIFNFDKETIISSIILNGINTLGVVYVQFIVVRDYLYPSMMKIITSSTNVDNNSNYYLLWDVSKYAIILFVASIIGCLCRALASQIIAQSVARSISCLLYQLFNKLLLIDINQPDKQQLLTIVGAEMTTLFKQLEFLISYVPVCIYFLIVLMILLYEIVGITSFFGILFIILCVPFQLFAGVKYAQNSKKRMNVSAKRVQLITQVISGIRFLKCNVSEIALINKIDKYRLNELKYVKQNNVFILIMFVINLLSPALMVFVILMVYMFVFKNNVTTLTVISLVMTIQLSNMISKLLPLSIAATGLVVSTTKRIDEFLNKKQKSIQHNNNNNNNNNNEIININNALFKWNIDIKKDSNSFMLKNICLKINKGKLIAIIGSVGSGKTALIHSILGEMQCFSGNINVDVNSYGYCSQCPFIQNATFRDNIIMDLEFDEKKYKQCIFAADLESDLKQLPFGDLTEIGTEGVNLSGGQKMRLTFARTLYRKDKYDLFILDNPLSSVDIYVGKHMFFNGILKYLQLKKQNKTCLMTMNSHLYLLKYFDEIVIVENGEIKLHTKTEKLFNKP
eukprot:328518_1